MNTQSSPKPTHDAPADCGVYVTNKGKMWHVIHRATNKTLGFKAHYKEAVNYAKCLERQLKNGANWKVKLFQ